MNEYLQGGFVDILMMNFEEDNGKKNPTDNSCSNKAMTKLTEKLSSEWEIGRVSGGVSLFHNRKGTRLCLKGDMLAFLHFAFELLDSDELLTRSGHPFNKSW